MLSNAAFAIPAGQSAGYSHSVHDLLCSLHLRISLHSLERVLHAVSAIRAG